MRALIGGVLIGLVAGLVVQELRHGNLRKVNQQLHVNVAELQRQIDMRPPSAVAPVSAGLTEEERSELLRLRHQAAQLRSATNELQQLRAQLARSGRATGAGDLANSSSASTGEIIPRRGGTTTWFDGLSARKVTTLLTSSGRFSSSRTTFPNCS